MSTRFASFWALLLAMVATRIAGAQPAPSTPAALCAADCDRCAADFGGEFSATPVATPPQNVCALGARSERSNCAASCLPARICTPTLIGHGESRNITLAPGESVVVTCSSAVPRRPNRVVVNQQLIVRCDEGRGAVASAEHPGTCECNPVEGFVTPTPVVISHEVVGNRLVATYRISPTAREVAFGCLYVPTGTPRPANEAELLQIRTDITNVRTDLQGAISNASGMQNQVNRIDGRLRAVENRPVAPTPAPAAPTTPVAPAAPATPATRLGVGLGGFFLHMPGASDVGGLGLTLALLQQPADWTVGLLFRVNLGLGLQPVVPGRGPLWSLEGSVQAHIKASDWFAVNVGVAAGSLSRAGTARAGEVTGGTAWFVALAAGPEFTIGHLVLAADLNVGVGQTVALLGRNVVEPMSFPNYGASARAVWYFN